VSDACDCGHDLEAHGGIADSRATECDKCSCSRFLPCNAAEPVKQYLEWLDTQMRYFFGNPQVCRTYYECLTRLQSMLDLPITEFKVPDDAR
jgi:hypothetical protein